MQLKKMRSRPPRSRMKASKRLSAPRLIFPQLLDVFEIHRRSVWEADIVRPGWTGLWRCSVSPIGRQRALAKVTALSGEPLEHVENWSRSRQGQQSRSCRAKGQPAPESKQQERAARYIEKNYPGGTDGVTTSAIRRKLIKDTDLEAELEKDDVHKSVPSDHDQSRARPPDKVTRQIFGHAQACPTMPKLKPPISL